MTLLTDSDYILLESSQKSANLYILLPVEFSESKPKVVIKLGRRTLKFNKSITNHVVDSALAKSASIFFKNSDTSTLECLSGFTLYYSPKVKSRG